MAFQRCYHFKNLVRLVCVTFNTSAGLMYLAFACTLVLQIFKTIGVVLHYFVMTVVRVVNLKCVIHTRVCIIILHILCESVLKSSFVIAVWCVCPRVKRSAPRQQSSGAPLLVSQTGFPGLQPQPCVHYYCTAM